MAEELLVKRARDEVERPDAPPVTLSVISAEAVAFYLNYQEVQYKYIKQPVGDGFEWVRVNFLYDELSTEAQEKAREWYTSGDFPFYDFPFYDWWESVYDWYADSKDSFVVVKHEQQADGQWLTTQLRPYFEPDKIDGFELDRGQQATIKGTFDMVLFVQSRIARLEDLMLRDKIVVDKTKLRRMRRVVKWMEEQDVLSHDYVSITHQHHGGGSMSNHDNWDGFIWNGDFDKPDWLDDLDIEMQEDLNDDIKEIEREVLRALQAEYDSLFEPDNVAENIRINYYTFDKDGERV